MPSINILMSTFSNINLSIGKAINTLNNIADLRNYKPVRIKDGDAVIVSAAAVIGDADGGTYVWVEGSTATDDGREAIRPVFAVGAGRWLKAFGKGDVGPQGIQGTQGPKGNDGAAIERPDIAGVSKVTAYGNPQTDAAKKEALTQAIQSTPTGSVVVSDTAIDLGTAPVANPKAVGFIGSAPIYYSTSAGGRRVQNMVNREPWLLEWGQEYLHVFLTKMFAGQPVKVVMFGDSNSAGYAGATFAEKMKELFAVEFINRSVSGSTIRNFIDNGWITQAINDNADLYINAYGGTNEAYFGRNADAFAADYDYVMNALRNGGGKGVRSILCRTSVPMNDATMLGSSQGNGFDKRDELYNFKCREIIRQSAMRYSAAFFDVNGRWPDSFVDFEGARKNTWLDGNRVHTEPAFGEMVAQALFDFVVPSALTGGRVVTGSASKSAATPPSQFPKGVSIYRTEDANASGGFGGFVVTFKEQATSFPMQMNWEFGDGTPKFAVRTTKMDGSWGAWGKFNANAWVEAPIVPISGLTLPPPVAQGGSVLGEQMRARVQSGFGRGSGFLVVDTPGILTAGLVVGTIPTAYGPSPTPVYKGKIFTVWDGIGLGPEHFETLLGSWAMDGKLTLLETSTLNAARIYLDCGFVRND